MRSLLAALLLPLILKAQPSPSATPINNAINTGSAVTAPWGPLFQFTNPTLQAFSWDSQGSATVTNSGPTTTLMSPANGAHNWNLRLISAPVGSYTITIAFIPTFSTSTGGSNPNEMGLVMRESSTAKMETCTVSSIGGATPAASIVSKFTNETTFSANYALQTWLPIGPVYWVRMTDNGTNILCQYSGDGVNFVTAQTQSRTDFMLTGPNQVGWGNDNVATGNAYMMLLSWKRT